MDKILLIGNWSQAIEAMYQLLKKEGYSLIKVALGEHEPQIKKTDPELIVMVLKQKELSDNAYISSIRQLNEHLPIIVVSDAKDSDTIVTTMQSGATDYISYPPNKDRLKKSAAHYSKMYRLTRKVFFLNDFGSMGSPFEGIVGVSERMQENFRMIQAVSKSNATVLITGESGTGKELVAKAIHHQSARAPHRFVDLNCGAIPRELLENELFGHEKGAFTGAHKRYCGSFEAAHKGTLFLDEISEMDPLLQVKLLRVLQERNFMRIGGNEKIEVDVRIVAATNRNLQAAIESGQFREDLFYRLNVVNIVIPSLRERREDIPILAMHFLEYFSAKNNRIFVEIAQDAMEVLINYDWPGNVRELENTLERIVVLNNDSVVRLKHLPKPIQKVTRSISVKDVSSYVVEENKVMPLDELEKQAIEMALMKFQGNISIAAKKLKIGQATLYRKVKKYGLIELGRIN